jgi:hypothetical protein
MQVYFGHISIYPACSHKLPVDLSYSGSKPPDEGHYSIGAISQHVSRMRPEFLRSTAVNLVKPT